MFWFTLSNANNTKKMLIRDPQSLQQVKERGLKQLELPGEASEYKLYMVDGAEICDDEDIKIEEIVGGVVIFMAQNWEENSCNEAMASSAEKAGKRHSDVLLSSQNMGNDMEGIEPLPQTPVRKKIKVENPAGNADVWEARNAHKELSPSGSSSSSSCEGVEPLEMCPFTPTVKRGLRDGDSESVWSMMLEQMSSFYLRNHPERLRNSGDYRALGRMMYARYPSIKRSGKHPWSHLNNQLSGRIRTARFTQKMKSRDMSPASSSSAGSNGSSPIFATQVDSGTERDIEDDDIFRSTSTEPQLSFTKNDETLGTKQSTDSTMDYSRIIKEVKKEWEGKKSPNKAHLKLLLKRSHEQRRRELVAQDNEGCPMMSTALIDWPLFEEGLYVMEEMRMILNKSERDMEQMYAKAKDAMKAIVSMVPKENLQRQGEFQVIDVLEYLHTEVGYKRGKGRKSTLPIRYFQDIEADKQEDKCSTVCNEAPMLFLFFAKDGTFRNSIVGGDRSIVFLQANDVIRALIAYIAVFYVFHIEYHREISMLLGFLQQVMIGLPYEKKNSNKSTGFVQLLEKFEKALKKVSDAKQFKKFCV